MAKHCINHCMSALVAGSYSIATDETSQYQPLDRWNTLINSVLTVFFVIYLLVGHGCSFIVSKVPMWRLWVLWVLWVLQGEETQKNFGASLRYKIPYYEYCCKHYYSWYY